MAPENPELRELVNEMNRSKLAKRFKNGNREYLNAEGEIFPSSVIPVIATSQTGTRRVFPMKWGFSRQQGGLLINARAETAADKPAFRESWKKHRCVVPVSLYFEWEHDEKKKAGQKYALRPEGHELVRLAGLYRMEGGIPVFVILTRPADSSLMWMHDRMPVMLREQDAEKWILPGTDPQSCIAGCLTKVSWVKAV